MSCLSALAFAAFKFQLAVLAAGLSSPLIQAWTAHGKWSLPPVKEAIPLPLPVLRRLESALLSLDDCDATLLAAFLFMVWGGLRF